MSLDEYLPDNDLDKLLIECYYCHEKTAVHLYHNLEHNWSLYVCANKSCHKTYLVDWNNENNWFEQQKDDGENNE